MVENLASPYPDENEGAALVAQLFTEARREKKKYLPAWNTAYIAVRNRMYSQLRANWMPSPQASEVFPAGHTLIAWMTDQHPKFYTSPVPDPPPLPETEEFIAKKAHDFQVTFDSWWWSTPFQPEIEMALWDAFMYGTGILHAGYDPWLNDGDGSPTFTRKDPYSILPDPLARSDHDLRYIGEVRRVPMYELFLRFPDRAERVTPDGVAVDADRRPQVRGSFDVMSQGQLGATGVTGAFPGTPTLGIPSRFGPERRRQSGDLYTQSAVLKEFFVKDIDTVEIPHITEDGRVEDITQTIASWRYIAVAGNTVLADESDPYDHGQCPYVRLPLIEMGEFWAPPMTEHIVPMQRAMNRLLAAYQQNAEMTSNPIMINPIGSGLERTKFTPRPGLKADVNLGMSDRIRWLDPPKMSTDVMAGVQWWQSEGDRASGMAGISRGQNMRRREPAQAVDAVQEANFVRVRSMIRNYEEALRQVGTMTAANIVQFWTTPRVIPILAEGGDTGYLKLSPRHFWYDAEDGENTPLRFFISLEAGSTLPLSRQQRSAEIDALFFMGAATKRMVLEAHKIKNIDKILEEIKKDQAENPQPPPSPRRRR